MVGWLFLTAAILVVKAIAKHANEPHDDVNLWGQRVPRLPPSPPSVRPPLPPPAPPPPSPAEHEMLGTVQEGEFVKLTGQIQHAADSLTAPLSGRTCVAYIAIAQAWRARRVPHPTANAREMKIAPLVLVLRDGEVMIEGECVVELRTAAVSPRAPERELAFLATRKLASYLPSTRFAEAVVHAGDRIWVSGVLLRNHAGEHGYRDLPQRMRLVGMPGRPLTIGRAR